MSKFNVASARPVGRGPIVTNPDQARNHAGGAGFARDARSELFLLSVTNMVGEKTFYESAYDRDDRFGSLVRQIAAAPDPDNWLARFAGFLRGTANMRSASLVLAAEAVVARQKAGIPGGRQIVNSVLQRADEPGELIAYWHAHHGRNLPIILKKGIADAATRLYSERSMLKYDTASHGVRFADVIRLTHPAPKAGWQDALFNYAIGKRLGVDDLEITGQLPMLRANAALRKVDHRYITAWAKSGELAQRLADGGFTWEDVPNLAKGPWTRELWEAVIPSMGYMALLRNLRNFDQAGVFDDVAFEVGQRLADPEEVAKSRQFPMRFLSAFNAAPSLRWAWHLEQALDHSLANIPPLTGRTLVLIDTSASMNEVFSRDGSLYRWDAATMFGLALGRRADDATVVSFSNNYMGRPSSAVFPQSPGESLLKSLERWRRDGYFLNGGTDTASAVMNHFNGHDRVVILTDEQAQSGNIGKLLSPNVPIYTANLAGYQHGHTSGPNRFAFGGLTDVMFKMIPALDAGNNSEWPF